MNKNWLEQFNENYYGRSKEAQELEKYLKSTFKGNAYIPWAVMERMTYQQDADASFTKHVTIEGGMIITSVQDIEADVKGEHSLIKATSHFVRVSLTFLGKTFDELYPIQDQAYGAPKVYDQNMVNKAFQRATAKVASRATGLGLSLYENGELQFDDDERNKKRTTPEKTATALEVMKETVIEKVETPKESGIQTDTVSEIIKIIINDASADKVNNALRSFNPSFIKQFGFSISRTDSLEELKEKLSKISDPSKFLTSLERLVK